VPAEGCPILTRSLQDQQEAVKTLLSLASAAVTIMGYTDKKKLKITRLIIFKLNILSDFTPLFILLSLSYTLKLI